MPVTVVVVVVVDVVVVVGRHTVIQCTLIHNTITINGTSITITISECLQLSWQIFFLVFYWRIFSLLGWGGAGISMT